MASNTTAHIPSGVYLFPASTTLTHSRSPTLDTEFIDHYAIMGLDNWATSEEIKTAFRHLRGTYFNADAVKYRALQAAFDILADQDARWTYDRVWRERMGLSRLPPLIALNAGTVKERVSILERKDSKEVLARFPVEIVQEVKVEEEDIVVRTPLIGTRTYHSYVPILTVYEGQRVHPVLECARPKYILDIAKNAMP
jgi:hypothetical protein